MEKIEVGERGKGVAGGEDGVEREEWCGWHAERIGWRERSGVGERREGKEWHARG